MKVVHLLNTSTYSGAENVACQIITHVNKNEFDMVYCSPKGDINKKLEELEIKYYNFKSLSKKELKQLIKKEKPDIIHAHDFKTSFYASLFYKKHPFVSHIHCNPLWLKTKSPYSYIFRFIAKRTSAILGVSNSIVDDYIFAKNLTKKFINVSNPFSSHAIVEKGESSLLKEHYDLVYCGRLSSEKNPIKFVDIVAGLRENNPDIKALIIGDGELMSQVQDSIKSKNLINNVVILGFVDNPFPYIKNCKVICNTSIFEGFGLSVLEAMSLSKPAVCSNVGGLRNIVDESCGRLCDSNEDYIQEIDKLLNNRSYYSSKAECAKNKANAFDNYDNYFKRIETIYRTIMNNKKPVNWSEVL